MLIMVNYGAHRLYNKSILCCTLPFSALPVSLVVVLLGKTTQGKTITQTAVVDVFAMPTNVGVLVRPDESCSKVHCDTTINF